MVTNTFYQQHKRRTYTWKSPGDVKRNQIDYILIKNRFKNCIKQVKTCPGADIDSDHNPVIAEVEIKLKNPLPKTKRNPLPDATSLNKTDIAEKYLMEVKNIYNCLVTEETEQTNNEVNDIENLEVE